jgi:hypothetical protein
LAKPEASAKSCFPSPQNSEKTGINIFKKRRVESNLFPEKRKY